MIERFRRVPPWAWVGIVAAAGALVLVWHQFANDTDDTDWTTGKETQPPEQVPGPADCGPAHGSGRPMACGNGFRGRAYADVLGGLELGGWS